MDFCWEVMDSLMSGKAKIVGMTEYQQQTIHIQKAKLLAQIAAGYDGTYKQVLQAYAIKELNTDMGWSLPRLRGALFAELERTTTCNLDARLRCLRNRKKKTGMRYRDAALLGKLDAIAADKQLRAIFEGIVRSYQAQAVPIAERQPVPRMIEN